MNNEKTTTTADACPANQIASNDCIEISKEVTQTSSLDTPAHTFGVRG